jgi:hypothetical protein
MARQKLTAPWDIAKPILRKQYIEGKITDEMKPKEVWAMQPEFMEVKYENFRSNFARLKKSIKEHKTRADDDEAGYLHDMEIYTLAKDMDEYWDGSSAQQLLKVDIEKKRHEEMKPRLLWTLRPEYQKFTLNKFRGHIHQELRRSRETNYWIVKQRKKKQMALAKKSGEVYNDEDMDFLFDPVLNM